MTTYLVQIKRDGGYETALKTSSRRKALTTGYDLAREMYDGRVITEKGYVSQEWEIQVDK
jgi:hypothetical protein